jgi:hypothetical protein
MSATTFQELFENPTMEPYNGMYDHVLCSFAIAGDEWDATELFEATLAMGTDLANAYVGIFEYEVHPCGTTRLLHAPRWYHEHRAIVPI